MAIKHQAIIRFLNGNDYFAYTEAECIKQADAIMAGKWVAGKYISSESEVVTFDIRNIDWDIQATKSPNSFSLSLHSLIPVYCLSMAYHATGEESYLSRATSITNSWISYSKGLTSKFNRYTWYDHAVACRLRTIIFLEVVCDIKRKVHSEKEDFFNLIRTHCDWLTKDENYTKNHNHGIMQDMALIMAGHFLSHEDFLGLGVDRLKKQLQYAFPSMAAHVENSSGYNAAIVRFLFACSDFLREIGNPNADDIDKYKDGAFVFLTHLAMPSNGFPFTGDTYGSVQKKSRKHNTLKPVMKQYYDNASKIYGNLYWAISGGNYGIKPSGLAKVFHIDGYAFWRSSWDTDNATWTMLKSGFLSLTHKHKDDLSINLYTKGVNVFIDPGMYNYMVGNVMHDYLNSNFAHSGIIVDNMSYPLGRNLTHRAGILDLPSNPNFHTVRAYNNLYHGVYIDRMIIHVNENEFYIVDDIYSEETHLYQQNYHLSNEVKLVSHELGFAIIKLTDSPWNVCIVQHEASESVESKRGDTGDIATMSVHSAGPNKVTPTTSILFSKKASSTRFITKIAIVTDDKISEAEKTLLAVEHDSIQIGDKTVDITSRRRAKPVPIEVSCKPESLNIKNKINHTHSLESAYYLLDKSTGKTAESTGYTFENTQNLPIPKTGEYILRAYARSKGKETIFWNAGEVANGVFTSFPADKGIPYIQSSKYTGNSNKYTYKLIHQIPWECNVNWYVYKNGAGFDYVRGKSKFTYTFTEPGIYTIIYRFNVKYFNEVEVGNFPEIVVSKGLGARRTCIQRLARVIRKIKKDFF